MSRFQWVKRLLPLSIRRRLLALKQLRRAGRWLEIWLAGPVNSTQPVVFYGHDHIPQLNEYAQGGLVKFQRMQQLFPNSPRRFNILYMVSSNAPEDALSLRWLARHKNSHLVWNQNGVAYAGWHGPGWEWVNRPMAKLLHAADYVFYQSEFCKLSADHFLGPRQDQWEILYNPVDTTFFTPGTSPPAKELILLLAGNQYQFYRFEVALQTVASLVCQGVDAHLLVTGNLAWLPNAVQAKQIAQRLAAKLDLTRRVRFLGCYSQHNAPDIFKQAHILLHPKYNDPCPTVVLEAMACGLPVVYSHSGGVPELVSGEAGIGVPVELSWEQDLPPKPELMAQAVVNITEHWADYAAAARQRAVERFDLKPWLQRHREVFEGLLLA
jgi:glycosyltransferase involved in cell wall biosynthesis